MGDKGQWGNREECGGGCIFSITLTAYSGSWHQSLWTVAMFLCLRTFNLQIVSMEMQYLGTIFWDRAGISTPCLQPHLQAYYYQKEKKKKKRSFFFLQPCWDLSPMMLQCWLFESWIYWNFSIHFYLADFETGLFLAYCKSFEATTWNKQLH